MQTYPVSTLLACRRTCFYISTPTTRKSRLILQYYTASHTRIASLPRKLQSISAQSLDKEKFLIRCGSCWSQYYEICYMHDIQKIQIPPLKMNIFM